MREPPILEAKVIEKDIDDLLIAAANKLEREWPPSLPDESAVCLRGFVLISRNTFRTIRYFCADKPPDTERRLEYSLSASPLARVILEAVFNTAFLLEDLSARTSWFMKAGWRSMREDLDRLEATYGKDPDWHDYLTALRKSRAKGRSFSG